MKVTTVDVIKVLLKHARPYLGFISIIFISVALSIAMQLVTPWLYKQFFDVMIGDVAPWRGDVISTLTYILVFIFAAGFMENIFWRVAGFTNNHTQPSIMRDVERSSYDYLMNHSFRFFTNSFTGSLVRKVRRLSRSLETLLDQVEWHFWPVLISITGTIIVVWTRNPYLGLGILIWILIFIVQNIIFSIWKLKHDEKRSEVDSEVTAVLADGITNNLNVKLFNGHGYEMDQYRDVTQRYKRLQTFTWNLNDTNNAVQGVLMAVLEFGILFYALQLWQEGLLTIGDFALLQGYVALIFGKMWDIGRYIRDTYEAIAEAKEMVEILKTPHEVKDIKTAKTLKVEKAKIEFQAVDFSYAQTRKVLDKFTLKIKPKEKVALVGPSGAGKSTIVKLLFRFFDVQRGKIFIDGQRITKVTQDSLRSHIALVPQEAILFHRSLMENIRYGRPEAAEEEIVEAAKKARCHEFISELPDGYETLVGERGVKLSGGERQRVAIARAILKDAPILVLDEATSSLDSESESLIQDALEELMKDKTTIVIAHRLSTILKMDRIIVMKDGKVIDSGTHKELSKKKGVYKNLWDIQVGGFIQ